MVPPSCFLYKCNGTDSDHVSSAAIFQPHNVSSAAFCQLRCSVLTQRIADCQLGCKVSAHWQIVSSSVNSKLSLNAQLQFLGSIVICQLSLMTLQVCAPDLATTSPSAIEGWADKLEFCKVLHAL